ncbi:MAG TPA: PilZ domain-containing protein [Thiohalobacter sp.]|nr:PilZ domain-containing protein [Thiohalobacter sp.]
MFLTVPPQFPLPGVDTRAGAVRKWIDQLPYTNSLDTAHQLITRLRDLHHQPLEAARRHELLQCFLEAFQRLHEPLRRPLPATAEDTLAAARLHSLDRLTEELLIGYKYVINDAQQERRLLRRPRHLHQAVTLAMHLIALLLATRYQSYLPTDTQLWREAGTLLHYGREHALGPQPLAGPLPFAEHRLDTAASYALMAFMRLSDPFRLPHGTLWDCFAFLAAQIRRCGLQASPEPPDSPQARAVCIDCEPAEWRQTPPPDADPARWYWLDPSPLLQAIQSASLALEQGTPPARLDLSEAIGRQDARHLLQRLQTQFRDPPQRRLERFESVQTVQLAVGLEACFYLHNRGVSFDPRDYLAPEDEDAIEIGQTPGSYPPAGGGNLQAYRCNVLNRSAGGLAVELPGDGPPRIRVGELLAVNLDDTDAGDPQWLIATIRWLVRQPRQRELGLQYIAREITPCALRLERGGRLPPQPALETRITHHDTRYQLLITARGLFRPQRRLELLRGSQQQQIECTQLVESTGLYDRFCYTIV